MKEQGPAASCNSEDSGSDKADDLWSDYDLFRVTLGGRIASQLTNASGFDGDGDVSPDGTTVAYISASSGTPALWIMNATDGSNKRQVRKHRETP